MQVSLINHWLVSTMAKQKLRRSELARRLGIHRVVVTQTLGTVDYNWTLDNLAKWAYALGYNIEIKFIKLPKGDPTKQ